MSKALAVIVPMVIGSAIILYVTVFYKYTNSCWKLKCFRRGHDFHGYCKKHFK